MKKLLLVSAMLFAVAPVLSQQGPVRIHTDPFLPSRDLLERLGLTMAWSNRVPLAGYRDGFYSLQLFPGKTFTLLLAQSYQGMVIAINADTGDILWRTPVGMPYRPKVPVGVSDQVVFACRHETVYALDRNDGRQLLYTIDTPTGQPAYGQRMEGPPRAGLAADNQYLFICLHNRVVRYAVPNFRAAGVIPGQPSPPLIRTWHFDIAGDLSHTPNLSSEMAVFTTDAGTVYFLRKSNPGNDDKLISLGQFQAQGEVVAQPASHGSNVYVPCQDFFVYGLNAAAALPVWRFATQSPVLDAPTATDADLFVPVGKDGGLVRLGRVDGLPRWLSNDAVKFLATNQRFVYALDRQGKMLVLDYERGTALAGWDARDWVLPVPNRLTDRVYLASNDGKIICLRHRDHVQPMLVTTFEAAQPKGKVEKKKLEEKLLPPDEDQVKEKIVDGGR
jgi:outer membrane protein assembly factor BamB